MSERESKEKHIPVLLEEVIAYLDPRVNEKVIDGTAGFGGHSQKILEKVGVNGKVLMIEWDPQVAEALREKFAVEIKQGRAVVENDNYAHLEAIARRHGFAPVEKILLDIGISSFDIDQSGRGFTFQKDEPLDMRFSPDAPKSAYEIVNSYSEDDLEKVLREYGEEKFARRIARMIVGQRKTKPITTTFELAALIKKCLPGWKKDLGRSFQAIRIEANQELANLKNVLPQALEILPSGGRLAVISFHSLEDRIVKNYFRELKDKGLAEILTKKPVTAGEKEITANSRSGSAKMRVLQKI
ncbi:MAG: 16S rRNA (cytosine(1402)-N(4))-methyltransferase RsmH [Candidatus Paceibacterota bacterium]